MKKSLSIFLLAFYIATQCFLPKGNFSYIEQIPSLYSDFCKTNNTNDIFEFFEEQFFELGFEAEEDEPFEKEAKPVPFQTPSMHTLVFFSEPEVIQFVAVEKRNNCTFSYILKEYWVHAASIYHPPKNKLV